jgi:transglutaminase-like putative cysteine protease
MALAVSREIQLELYDAAAVVPKPARRIDDPGSVERLRVRLRGTDLSSPDLQGAGQRVQGDQIEIRDARDLPAVRREPGLERYLAPESFLESDAPEIVAEAQRATTGLDGDAAKAERLVRHVNALLEKRPTVSLPSALEVLRTRVGDCNEHTALFVALARAAGLPSRIAVGLVNLRGAFYYHAWPEVWLEAGAGRGRWIPVDPTLNQFPADLTHIRLARGGLEKQAAIVGMIGRLEMEVLEMEMAPGTAPILVGRDTAARPFDIAIPSRGARRGCWSKP